MRATIAKSVCLILMAAVTAGPAMTTSAAFPAAAVWRAAAASGDPVEIDLGARMVQITVAESRGLFAPGAEVLDLEGQPLRSRALPLTGVVAGEPGSWVRLTVAGEVVLGTVVVPGTGAFAVGMEDGEPVLSSGTDITRRLRDAGIDTVIEPTETDEPISCDSLGWVRLLHRRH